MDPEATAGLPVNILVRRRAESLWDCVNGVSQLKHSVEDWSLKVNIRAVLGVTSTTQDSRRKFLKALW